MQQYGLFDTLIQQPESEYRLNYVQPDKIFEGVLLQEVKVQFVTNTQKAASIKINTAEDVIKVLKRIWNSELSIRESIYALYLDRKNHMVGWSLIAIGGRSFAQADTAIIFQRALLCNCSNIIISHNHPSKNLAPSQSDISMTRNLISTGKQIGIGVIDHLIVSPDFKFFSMANENTVNF